LRSHLPFPEREAIFNHKSEVKKSVRDRAQEPRCGGGKIRRAKIALPYGGIAPIHLVRGKKIPVCKILGWEKGFLCLPGGGNFYARRKKGNQVSVERQERLGGESAGGSFLRRKGWALSLLGEKRRFLLSRGKKSKADSDDVTRERPIRCRRRRAIAGAVEPPEKNSAKKTARKPPFGSAEKKKGGTG